MCVTALNCANSLRAHLSTDSNHYGMQLPGTRYQVPDSWFLVPGSWFRAPGSSFLVQAPETRWRGTT
jgi:hypothetical protein